MKRPNLAAAAALVMLTGCARHGAVYPAPIAEARQTLVATGLPPQVFGSSEPAWDVRDGGSDITWTVRSQGAEVFHYVAHLTEEGPGATRVELELKGVEGGPGGNVAQRLSEHPEIRNLYLVAIGERIASALEHRDFETTRLYPAMTVATMVNLGALSASFDQAAAASRQHDRENIEKAYREEAAGRP